MNPGTYSATVIKTRFGEASTGTPFISVQFSVTDDTGTVEEIWGNIYLSPKAMPMARKSLKAIGFDIDNRSLCDLEDQPEILASNECEIVVDEEEYRGVASLKVKYINRKRTKLGRETLSRYDAALRAAKHQDEDVGDSAGLPTEDFPEGPKAAPPSDIPPGAEDLMTPKPGDPDYQPPAKATKPAVKPKAAAPY